MCSLLALRLRLCCAVEIETEAARSSTQSSGTPVALCPLESKLHIMTTLSYHL